MKILHVTILDQRSPEDDPKHLCRVGITFEVNNSRRSVMADVFDVDLAKARSNPIGGYPEDARIHAIEIGIVLATQKLFTEADWFTGG